MHHTFAVTIVSLSLLASALAQDPLTKQALQRIEEIEKKEPSLAAGDAKAAALLQNNLEWAGKRLAAVADKTEAKWLEAQKRYGELRQKLEAKAKAAPVPATGNLDTEKLTQLDKEIANAFANFRMLSTKHLADPYRTQSTQKEIDGLGARLAAFPADHAAVQPVAARLAEFRAAFTAAMAQLEKDVGAGAAVSKHLAELDTKYDAKNLPVAIEPPFDVEPLRAWATEVKRWRDTEIPADQKVLEDAARNAAVDQQHVSRLRTWLDEGWRRRIAEIEQAVRARVESLVTEGQRVAEFVLATDPKDKDQVANRILGQGRFDENVARLRNAGAAVAAARVLDSILPPMPPVDRDPQAAATTKALDHLQKLAVVCLDAVRMPPSASTDAELLKIATDTLKNPAYDVPAAERLVISADRTHHERREGWIKAGATDTATVTVHTYAWDQFQVTTAEKSGEEVWLWANTLKRYESGDPTTPVGRWILGNRLQLTRILPENVAR